MSIKNKHRKKNRHKILDMEVGLLMEDAEEWWDKKARDMLKKRTFSNDNREQQAALDATNPVHPNYVGGKSGILLGLPWTMLKPMERYQVLKAYTLAMKEAIDEKTKHNTTGSLLS
jgi:hypothetical protein